MSAESRLWRRRRNTIAKYTPHAAIAVAVGIGPADVEAWVDGDARVRGNHRDQQLWDVFSSLVIEMGFIGAGDWFANPRLWNIPETPAQVVATWESDDWPASLQPLPSAAGYDFDQLDKFGGDEVALAGDWHGNTPWALKKLKDLHANAIRTVLHVGDFGLWPSQSGSAYLRAVTEACKQYDMTIYVTDGNHEDHDRLAAIEPVDGKRWVSDHVAFYERGHRWRWQDHTFVSFGGAASIDYEHRTEGVSWWPGEVPTDAEVARAIAGGPADVLLTHDAPSPGTPTIEQIIRTNPLGLSREARTYAQAGRSKVTRVFRGLQPRLNVHGHMHYDERITRHLDGFDHPTETISLSCDGDTGNIAILRIWDLKVTVL